MLRAARRVLGCVDGCPVACHACMPGPAEPCVCVGHYKDCSCCSCCSCASCKCGPCGKEVGPFQISFPCCPEPCRFLEKQYIDRRSIFILGVRAENLMGVEMGSRGDRNMGNRQLSTSNMGSQPSLAGQGFASSKPRLVDRSPSGRAMPSV